MKKGEKKGDKKDVKNKSGTEKKVESDISESSLKRIIEVASKFSSAQESELPQDVPSWFIGLFDYLFLFQEMEIKVDSISTQDSHYKANIIARQLFLIFECIPRKDFNGKKIYYRDFAREAGVSEQIIGRWRKEKWFWSNRTDIMKRIYSLRTPEIMEALYDGSTTSVNEYGKKDIAAIKLWLEYIEGFKPGLDLTSGGKTIGVSFASGSSPFIKQE